MDNALESCQKVPEQQRNVRLQLTHQSSVLSVSVTNNYNPAEINIVDGKALTTKSDKSLHGIGLKRIQQAVDKYDGIFEYHTTNSSDENLFIADVLLYTST